MEAPLTSFWEVLAAKLEAQPELLEVARSNCARWLRDGHSGAVRLREWDSLLAEAQAGEAGWGKLRAVLAGANEHSNRLRDFHPFAGVLTREERRRTRELCGYRH